MEEKSVRLYTKPDGKIEVWCIKHSKPLSVRSAKRHFSNKKLHPELDTNDVQQWQCIKDIYDFHNCGNNSASSTAAHRKRAKQEQKIEEQDEGEAEHHDGGDKWIPYHDEEGRLWFTNGVEVHLVTDVVTAPPDNHSAPAPSSDECWQEWDMQGNWGCTNSAEWIPEEDELEEDEAEDEDGTIPPLMYEDDEAWAGGWDGFTVGVPAVKRNPPAAACSGSGAATKSEEWWHDCDNHGALYGADGTEWIPEEGELDDEEVEIPQHVLATAKHKAIPPVAGGSAIPLMMKIKQYVQQWTDDKWDPKAERHDWPLELPENLDLRGFKAYLRKMAKAAATADIREVGIQMLYSCFNIKGACDHITFSMKLYEDDLLEDLLRLPLLEPHKSFTRKITEALTPFLAWLEIECTKKQVGSQRDHFKEAERMVKLLYKNTVKPITHQTKKARKKNSRNKNVRDEAKLAKLAPVPVQKAALKQRYIDAHIISIALRAGHHEGKKLRYAMTVAMGGAYYAASPVGRPGEIEICEEASVRHTLEHNLDFIYVEPDDHKTGDTEMELGKYMTPANLQMAGVALDIPGRVGTKFLQPCNPKTKHVAMHKILQKDCQVYTPGYGYACATLKRKGWKTEWDNAMDDNTSIKEARAMVDRVNAHSTSTANKYYKLNKAAGDAKRAKEIAGKIMGEEVPWPSEAIAALTTARIDARIAKLVQLYSRQRGKKKKAEDSDNGSEEGGEEEDSDKFSEDDATDGTDSECGVADEADGGSCAHARGSGDGAAESEDDDSDDQGDLLAQIRQPLKDKGVHDDDLPLSELPKVRRRPTQLLKPSPVSWKQLRVKTLEAQATTESPKPVLPALRKPTRTRVMILPEAQTWIISKATEFFDGSHAVPPAPWFDGLLQDGIRLGHLTPEHNPQGLRSLVRRTFGWGRGC